MSLKQRYRETIQPKLLKDLDLSNVHEFPNRDHAITVHIHLLESLANLRIMKRRLDCHCIHTRAVIYKNQVDNTIHS